MGLSEDLDRVSLQERELQFDSMDEQRAWEIGSRLRAMAVERELSIVIDIRRFGQPLFYTALHGTTPDNVEWVRRKSNVVARFHRSSYGIGLHLKNKNDSIEARGLPTGIPLVHAHESDCRHRCLHARACRVPGPWSNPYSI